MTNIKVVFMGTPSFAVPVLNSLIENYNVVLVVCQPDKEKDRKGNIIYPPIKELAIKHNIPVYQPNKIRNEYEEVLKYNPDIIITCAYGQFIPNAILDYPKHGCINVHGSLLPKLRGGAPIHWAIINGEQETGMTIMHMSEKMDAGDIISQKSLTIKEDDYLDIIYEKMSHLGSELLIETLPSIINGTANRIKQNEDEVTFGYNIKKEDEKIDFNKSSKEIHNLVRGLNSVPGAYCMYEGKRMKVYVTSTNDKKYENKTNGEIVDITKDSLIVKTEDGSIEIKDIKLEGKNRQPVKDYLNGIKNKQELIGIILE